MHAVLHSGASSCGPVLDRQPVKQTRLGRVQQLQAREGCTPQGTAAVKQPSTSNTSTQWSGAPSQDLSAQANAASEQCKVKAKPASHRPCRKAGQPSTWAAMANMGGGLMPSAEQLCQQQQQATQCVVSGQSQGKHCLVWFIMAAKISVNIMVATHNNNGNKHTLQRC